MEFIFCRNCYKDWGTYDGMLAILDKNNTVVSMPGGNKPTYDGSSLIPPIYDQKTFLIHMMCV